jgi:ribosomal protein L11 methyltransferase
VPDTDLILQITLAEESRSMEETVEGLLYLEDCAGSVLEEKEGALVIRAFFENEDARSSAAQRLRRAGVSTLEFVDAERLDWLERYEQSLEPIEIGERFLVVPASRLIPEASRRFEIIVPQERAFGTGSHETTALCLATLEKLDVAGKRCVDIGTGSAILAIGMIRLGATKVIAFDNDLDAFEAIRKNLRRNGIVPGLITPYIGGSDALRGGGFELATMNIIPEVIIPLLPSVRGLLAEGATIIFSGILVSARERFLGAARTAGFALKGESSKGEWWCGAMGLTP